MKCQTCGFTFCACPSAPLTPGAACWAVLPSTRGARGSWGQGYPVPAVVEALTPSRVRVRLPDGSKRWLGPGRVRVTG